MKKSFRGIISILLVFVMFFGIVPIANMNFTTKAGALDTSSYAVGDIISFGSYPQSEVTDSSIISDLESIDKTWISYNYYSGSGSKDGAMVASDYMKYADVTYNSERYRAVTFTQLRPYFTWDVLGTTNSNQTTNGYNVDNVYWFKFEPLKWRILDPNEGFVLSETVIDAQAFNNYVISEGSIYYGNAEKTSYVSNYANSSIRQWLNDDFYNTAFDSAQRAEIQSVNLDNRAHSISAFDSADTKDKVFLLSSSDLLKTEYEFDASPDENKKNLKAFSSEYARCQGLWILSSTQTCLWWLRDAADDSLFSSVVFHDGSIFIKNYQYYSVDGVRPAIKINKDYFKEVTSVSINDVTVKFKASATITPTITADEGAKYTVAFSSSDPECVKVDNNGIVTGVKAGTATITCTVTDSLGNVVTDTCTVTVKNTARVNSVSIADTSVNVKETITITPTISADDGAEYTTAFSSSDSTVATVDKDGVVSGVKAGTAVITCTVTDSLGNVVTDTCIVTVNAPKVTSIAIGSTVININSSAKMYTSISAEEGAEYTVEFSSSNPEIATVDNNGVVYGVSRGTAMITFTVYSGFDTFSVKASVVVNGFMINSVSIDDIYIARKESTTIAPTISAEDGAEYTVTYSSSNPEIATVDNNGVVVGVKTGKATITCTVTDSYGKVVSDNCEVSVFSSIIQWIINFVYRVLYRAFKLLYIHLF